jgi:FixJ family two-component response regulator
MIAKIQTTKQTVFIVDDDASICEGLSNLLESVNLSAQTFSSAEDFLAQWSAKMAGCLVLDYRLPGMTGAELQETMRNSGIEIPIIFMTAHGDVPMVRKVMKAGAIEFLTKPFEIHELLSAIEHAFVYDRNRRKDEEMRQSILDRIHSLTRREREVLAMVTAGLLNKQIAGEMNLSEVTVKLHRKHVMQKMRVDSLAELVKLCERAGVASNSGAAGPQ